jgi:hypothetical protein
MIAVPATSALADSDPTKGIPGLTDSAQLSGAPFATGKVTDREGNPPPAGQLVVLDAWPSQATLSKLQIGEAVKTAPVAFAFTSADGTFDLRISDHKLLANYPNADGIVDFEIQSTGDGYASVFAFSSTVSASAKDRPAADVKAVLDIAPRFIDEQEGVDKTCGTYLDRNLGPAWVNVGYGYIAGSGATMKFTYNSGASSSLGVGFSTTGAVGTFSASGTSSASSTATVTFPSTTSFKVWKTQFNYGVYATICSDAGGLPYTYYQARADSYVGGSSVQTVTGYPAYGSNCTSFVAGSTFTKSTTAAYNSSVGAATAPLFGINVSASTGYTSTASLKFTFTATKSLCGTNGYPGGTPGRLVAP